MICIINAQLIDNIEPKSYLASLVIDTSLNALPFNDFFFECKVVKIIKQDKVLDTANALKVFNLSFSNLIIDKIVDFKKDYLFPSFIDFHCHSEFLYLNEPSTNIRRDDLIGDEVVGNCGISIYPVVDEKFNLLKQNVLSILGDWPEIEKWNDFSSFMRVYKSLNVRNNLMFLQGHSALRIACIEGNPNRKANRKEVLKMQNLLSESLSQGAIGFSTGLYYAPCIFADNYEIESLLEVVGKYDGIFAIHRREEGNKGLESTIEAINLAKKGKVRLQISHLKAIGDSNQKQVDRILDVIEKARLDGLDVAFDQYPFVYGSTSLSSLLPPFVLKDGEIIYKEKLKNDKNYREKAKESMLKPDGFESIAQLVDSNKIFIQYSDSFPDYISKSIYDIANERGTEPIDAILDVLCDEQGVCTMKDITQTEENLIKIMSHPLSLFGTDALYAGGKWHERSTNAARYMLKKYSKHIGIENLVARSTSRSSQRLNLVDKKMVVEGVKTKLVRFSL